MSGQGAELASRLERLGVPLVEDTEALRGYATAAYPVSGSPPACCARPSDAVQVAAIVGLARELGANVVPVSSGPPHAKGGSLSRAGALVVDLSGMDRVVRLDRRNRVAVVEPGVTFGALRESAKAEGMRPLTPLLPRSSKSVIGSYIEREPTLIPKYQWDTTDPLLCVEVVFGTGETFRTGSAAGPGSLEDQWELGNAQKNPMGPAATDLLKVVQGAQGTMGIVTWASVKLELEPAVRRFFFVRGEDVRPLLSFARELLRRKLGDEMLLLDRVNMACLRSCPDGERTGPRMEDPRFTLLYAVAGYPGYLPEERVAYQERDIADIAARAGVVPERQAEGSSAGRMAGLLGGPSPEPHWKASLYPGHLDVFFLTTLDRVPDFVEAVDAIVAAGDGAAAVGIYVQPVQQGRSCHLEFDIYHDPGDEASKKRAAALAARVCSTAAGLGAFFSSPYEPWVSLAYEGREDTVDALRRVKGVFDPDGVMNRGRLCFRGGA